MYITIGYVFHPAACETVWPSGKALVRLVSGRHGFDSPLRLSFLLKSCGLWTMSCDFAPDHQRNIKTTLTAADLNAEIILAVTV